MSRNFFRFFLCAIFMMVLGNNFFANLAFAQATEEFVKPQAANPVVADRLPAPQKAEPKFWDAVSWWQITLVVALICVVVWLLKKSFKKSGVISIVSNVLLACFFFGTAANGQCWRESTGKTAGSGRKATAVLGVLNTFICQDEGKEVKLAHPADLKKVLITPVVKNVKGKPLTFEFTPTSVGRMYVLVDGKQRNMIIVRGLDDVKLIDDTLDLVPKQSTGKDTNNRLVSEGMITFACNGDAACVTRLKADAWGSTPGSSAKAGQEIARLIAVRASAPASSGLSAEDRATLDQMAKFMKEYKPSGTTVSSGGGMTQEAADAMKQMGDDIHRLEQMVNQQTARINQLQNQSDNIGVEVGVHATRIGEVQQEVADTRQGLAVVAAAAVTDSKKNRCEAYHFALQRGMVRGDLPKGCK